MSNSQCTVSSPGPVTASGNNVTVPFGITFAPGFTGQKSLYGYAQSNGGATSGWLLLGAWTPSASTLTITTTALPGDTVNTPYSATVSATGGTAPYAWSATGLPAGLTINPSTGQLTGSPTTAGTSTVMVTVTDSSSPTLVAKASLQITITPISSVPSAVSVNPNTGAGQAQAFSAVYTDPAGSGDLAQVNLLFNTSTNGANACWVYYVPASNAIYLINDSGTGQVPGSIDVSRGRATLSNSQCTLSSPGPVTTSGNNLTVAFGITFAPGFTGQKSLYGYAQSISGANSGWQLLGTWIIGP